MEMLKRELVPAGRWRGAEECEGHKGGSVNPREKLCSHVILLGHA